MNFRFNFAGIFLSTVNISRRIHTANCSIEVFMDIPWFCYLANLHGYWIERFARGFVSMNTNFVFDTMHGNLESWAASWRFVASLPFSNCQFIIIGKFEEATKIPILSNDQPCHLCDVGPIVYSISCTPEAANLN